MYISTSFTCFYSSIFGYKTQAIIPHSAVTRIRKGTVAGIFPGALVFDVSVENNPYVTKQEQDPTSPVVKYLFASFLSRDPVIETLKGLAPQAFVETEEEAEAREAKEAKPIAKDVNAKEKEKSKAVSPPSLASPAKSAASSSPSSPNTASSASTSAAASPASPRLPASLHFGKNQPTVADPVAAHDVEMAEVVTAAFPCSAATLWSHFFADAAPRGFVHFHAIIKQDHDVRASAWLPAPVPGYLSSPPAGKVQKQLITPPPSQYAVREFAINTPLSSPIGPARIDMYKQQRAALTQTDAGVAISIVNTSFTPEAPFGENFYILENWRIEDTAQGCSLRMWTGVVITDRPWKMRPFISTLVSRAKEDSGKQYNEWADWAKPLVAEAGKPKLPLQLSVADESITEEVSPVAAAAVSAPSGAAPETTALVTVPATPFVLSVDSLTHALTNDTHTVSVLGAVLGLLVLSVITGLSLTPLIILLLVFSHVIMLARVSHMENPNKHSK
jgi:hypothetical protein